MRAAVLEAFGEPLRLRERPDPDRPEGHVLVEVRAVGLCGTDLKIVDGHYPGTSLPLVPGHEVAGVVLDDAPGLPRGTRVACYPYDPCGACRWCAAGQDTLCPLSRRLGFERDGGLGGRVTMRPANLLPFGEGLDFAAAAVAMDAVSTVWRAVRVRGALAAGETVVIAGAGGLGLNAVQVARDGDARVAVLDPVAARREAALELGAELALAPEQAARIFELFPDGADLSLEISGTRAGFDAAVAALRPGGRIVCVGYRPGLEYGTDSHRIIRGELDLYGSRNGSRADAGAALRAVEKGAVRPAIARRYRLDQINDALQRMRSQAEAGRIVVEVNG